MNGPAKKILKRALAVLIIAALLDLIIAGYVFDTTYAADQSIIRVKLTVGTPSEVDFSLNGNYGIKGNPGTGFSTGSYSVKVSGSALQLYKSGTLLYTGADIYVEERTPAQGKYNYASITTTSYGTNSYLGSIDFKFDSGHISVVNFIYIEYYLYGVVPSEMSNSWPLEALKAQAVAARTYAQRYMNGPGYYDLVDTPANQAYKGFNPSNTNAKKAVDDTAKTVLKCNGSLVQAYYCASNGGYTDIPQHVWSVNTPLLPYNVIQQDPYDVQNAWSLQEALIFPKIMEGSAGIQYKYSSSGSMVTGKGNESANAQRYLEISALPAVAAKGYIAAVTSDIQIIGINSMTPRIYEGHHDVCDYTGTDPCVCFTQADINMTVLAKRAASEEERQQTGSDYIEEQATVSFTINLHEFDKPGGLYQAFDNSSLRLISVTETDSGWNIYHRRYGHGIGMSQRGAEQRAKAGQTYQQILSFYYPGASLEALDISLPVATDTPAQHGTNATIVNCTAGVNVRSTPDTRFSPIGTVFPGNRITVTQPFVTQQWHKIDFGGLEGYINSYYVLLDPLPPPSPSVSPAVSSSPDQTGPSPSSSAASPPVVSPSPPVTPTPAQTVSQTPVSPSPTPIKTVSQTPVSPSPTPTKTVSQTPVSPSPTAPDIIRTGTVTAGTLNIRSGPGSTYGLLGSLKQGDAVSIIQLEPVQNWHKIWYKGKEGYVWADYVSIPEVKPGEEGVVTASVVNVRSGPGTSYGILGTLSKGDKTEIVKLNYTSGWHQIYYKGGMAYVNASYIKINDAQPADNLFAQVSASRLNLRAEASTSGKVYATLTRGTMVQVITQGALWDKVMYSGHTGYMYTKYLTVLSGTYGKVTAGALNVRSGASSSSPILGTLKTGDTVRILEKGSKWYKITYKTSFAYVYAAYIKLQ